MTPADATVFIPARRGGREFEVFHTDQDCHLLAKADDTRPVVRAVLPDDLRECRACQGVVRAVNDGIGAGHFESLKAAADREGSA